MLRSGICESCHKNDHATQSYNIFGVASNNPRIYILYNSEYNGQVHSIHWIINCTVYNTLCIVQSMHLSSYLHAPIFGQWHLCDVPRQLVGTLSQGSSIMRTGLIHHDHRAHPSCSRGSYMMLTALINDAHGAHPL